ncbi:hypothetical protein SMICM304S_05578 [Streptomyces microflavus]
MKVGNDSRPSMSPLPRRTRSAAAGSTATGSMRLRPMRCMTAIAPAPFFFSAAGAVSAVVINILHGARCRPGH